MSNANQLHTEYDRVKRMCVGTALQDTPWKCVQFFSYSGRKWVTCGSDPGFNGNGRPWDYRFAKEIINDEAVFNG